MSARKLNQVVILAALLALSSTSLKSSAAALSDQDRSSDALQARLDDAENNFRAGKVTEAIAGANSLLNVTDSSFFHSDRLARDAKADLAVFQFKAGNADQSAKLIHELFVSLQLDLQAESKFSTEPAEVLAGAPKMLKDYFSKTIDRLHETAATHDVINSLIENTYPKDYATQLSGYCGTLQSALHQLDDLNSIAQSEEMKFVDPQGDFSREDADAASNPKLSKDNLEKLGTKFNTLAMQAEYLPAGDLRAAHALYTVALLASAAQRYGQAETFAEQCRDRLKAMASDAPLSVQTQLVLAYSLLKQEKTQDFNSLQQYLLKRVDDDEPQLVSLARLTLFSGDKAGAASIYKRALDNRDKHKMTSPPGWIESYNQLTKELGSGGAN